jgi:hypothetical protein
MIPSQNPADCWWQIPPFGKDFHHFLEAKIDEIPKDIGFRISGTPIA